jgi:hypothetical protein
MNGTESSPFPRSGGKSIDKDGVDTAGYITKKGTPSGEDARFNALPPGMNIDDQKVAEINSLPMKEWNGGLSYEGDGGY